MKLNGASWADAQAKMKAGNIEGIAVNAETMALNSEHIPMLFPEGSLTDKSKAKPEIWQKRPEFDSAAKNMGQWAVKLRDTARTKDAAASGGRRHDVQAVDQLLAGELPERCAARDFRRDVRTRRHPGDPHRGSGQARRRPGQRARRHESRHHRHREARRRHAIEELPGHG